MKRCELCHLNQPEHLMRVELGRWFCLAVTECKERAQGH